MLLTITLTQPPATDLGYLLHKHPERVQEFALAFGKAHVFYPEVADDRTTAALLLDVDPVRLDDVALYTEAYRRYCWPVEGVGDLKLAPFHLLASERSVHVDKPHSWHMERIERLCAEDQQLLRATANVTVDTTDPESEARRPRGGRSSSTRAARAWS